MGWLSSRSGKSHGPKYDPHRPWLLLHFRPGGGKVKRMEMFASQAEAAFALRQELRQEAGAELDHRYAFLIKHVTGGPSFWWAWNMDLATHEWRRLAQTQMLASRSPHYGSKRRHHGNADLQPGRFYGYKGRQVWLDTVPGGFFAMVQGTAIEARGKTAGEALKRLREKLDASAANYRRRKTRAR